MKKRDDRSYRIYPEKGAYYVFVDGLKDVAGRKMLKFSEMAKWMIMNVERGQEELVKSCNGLWVSRSVLIRAPGKEAFIYPEGRPDIFLDKRKERKAQGSPVTFLETVGGCDYQMAEWITDSRVFRLTEEGFNFRYQGEITEAMVGNHKFYGSPNTIKEILAGLESTVSDEKLLLALMEGDQGLAKEFQFMAESMDCSLYLGDLHKMQGSSDRYITSLMGCCISEQKGKKYLVVTSFFADDYFRFVS